MDKRALVENSFELSSYRTSVEDGEGEMRLHVFERFINDLYFLSKHTPEEIEITWIGKAVFAGVPLDKEQVSQSFVTHGVLDEYSEETHKFFQQSYNDVANRFFRGVWKDTDSVYLDSPRRAYSEIARDDFVVEQLRDAVETRVGIDGIESHPISQGHIDFIEAILDGLPSVGEDNQEYYMMTDIEVNQMSKAEERALELMIQGAFLDKPKAAMAQALMEEGIERDIVIEKIGEDSVATAEDLTKRAKWTAENVS